MFSRSDLQRKLGSRASRSRGRDYPKFWSRYCLPSGDNTEWAEYLRQALGRDYRFAEFRDSKNRMGGGLGFLAKIPAHEIAYIPSETGWFDGWIMKFETAIGSVQIVNVHLRPPVSDSGSWVSGYFSTDDDRQREMERFYGKCEREIPTLAVGDFNEGEDSSVVRWLEGRGMVNALRQFDRKSPTWKWQTSVVTLKRRMDHILYIQRNSIATPRE